jgi:CRP-like cAMP-binding protein
MSDSVRVSLRIPPEVFEEIARESRDLGESLSDNMRRRLSKDEGVLAKDFQHLAGQTLEEHERRLVALEEMANRGY